MILFPLDITVTGLIHNPYAELLHCIVASIYYVAVFNKPVFVISEHARTDIYSDSSHETLLICSCCSDIVNEVLNPDYIEHDAL